MVGAIAFVPPSHHFKLYFFHKLLTSWRYSGSVYLSAPTILQPLVQIPTKAFMLSLICIVETDTIFLNGM